MCLEDGLTCVHNHKAPLGRQLQRRTSQALIPIRLRTYLGLTRIHPSRSFVSVVQLAVRLVLCGLALRLLTGYLEYTLVIHSNVSAVVGPQPEVAHHRVAHEHEQKALPLTNLREPPQTRPVFAALFEGSHIYHVSTPGVANNLFQKKVINAGDHLVITCGTYTDRFNLAVTRTGTAQRPIVIRPERAHCVTFNQATLSVTGSYVEIRSFRWVGPRLGNGTSAAVRFARGSRHNRVVDCMFDGFYSEQAGGKKQVLVELWGHSHRVEWNSLVNMNVPGELVRVMDSSVKTEEILSAGHRIAYNYFGPRPASSYRNGGEIIQVGLKWPHRDTQTVIEFNVFEGVDSDNEAVSLKASNNIVRANTIINSAAHVTVRHGANNTLSQNYFFCNRQGQPCAGLRVQGHDNRVHNNYMEGGQATGSRDRVDGAIVLHGGADLGQEAAGRWAATRTDVRRNLLVGCHWCVSLGHLAKSKVNAAHWPRDNTIANNVIVGRDQKHMRVRRYAHSYDHEKSFLVRRYTPAINTMFVGNVIAQGALPEPYGHLRTHEEVQLERNTHGLLVPRSVGADKVPMMKYRPIRPEEVGAGHHQE